MPQTHVAIIGNGIAGVTAARRIRALQPDWRITMISGESTHHYARPALMYVFMGHMRYQDTKPYPDDIWRRERIDLVRDWVTSIDPEGHALELHRGGRMAYDQLLIATGSRPNRFGWPGQDLPGVQGLYGLMDLHALYDNVRSARRAVIVGGGLIGVELAEMLHSRGIHVTMLVREPGYWSLVLPPEESSMVTRAIEASGIELRFDTELKEIVAGPDGRTSGVVTSRSETLEAQIVGLATGVSPNIDLVRGTSIAIGRGVLVDDALRTSVPDVLAAGDCAEITTADGAPNLVQQVWYTGRRQGHVAGSVIAGSDERYEPGVWFNSAKFLDLEYQTYGQVAARPTDDESQLWWEHRSGRRGMRIAYRASDHVVIGVNAMGMRARHAVWEQWISEARTLDDVLGRLSEAAFDGEFAPGDAPGIVSAFRAATTAMAT